MIRIATLSLAVSSLSAGCRQLAYPFSLTVTPGGVAAHKLRSKAGSVTRKVGQQVMLNMDTPPQAVAGAYDGVAKSEDLEVPGKKMAEFGKRAFRDFTVPVGQASDAGGANSSSTRATGDQKSSRSAQSAPPSPGVRNGLAVETTKIAGGRGGDVLDGLVRSSGQ